MTKGNVGSLLVLDPSKADPNGLMPMNNAAKGAVVGIFTERGKLYVPNVGAGIAFNFHMNMSNQQIFSYCRLSQQGGCARENICNFACV